MKNTQVTYIKHSGFYVETEKSCLLFDYWQGKLPEMPSGKNLYIFSSHVHHDHYTKDIFKLENTCHNVYFVLSYDIKQGDRNWKKASNVTFVEPYEKKCVGAAQISTLKSTDEGVAFLVEVDGVKIYHAGDLHEWYWPGDPDEDNFLRGENYHKEIDRLKGESIDLSFVVLDPRQEYAGGRGMDYFLKNVTSKYVFPMHLWEDYTYLEEYKTKNQKKYLTTQILSIDHCGQTFFLD